MRCSVSPFSRASAACMLMQLAQPLIWEARIFTSSTSVGSRLASTAIDVRSQVFIRSGAAAMGSSLGQSWWVSFCRFRHHDEPARCPCDIAGRNFCRPRNGRWLTPAVLHYIGYRSLGQGVDAMVKDSQEEQRAKAGTGTTSPARLIDAKIKKLGDWRGEMLARVRKADQGGRPRRRRRGEMAKAVEPDGGSGVGARRHHLHRRDL